MVTIFSMKNCSYCDDLKSQLTNLNIEYVDINIRTKGGKLELEKLSKIIKTDYVPIIIVNKNVLIPETSFQTIEQAVNIIQDLLTNK